MKKMVNFKNLLGASLALAMSFGIAFAEGPGATNKTFLMPRDVGTDKAREFTTWHKMRDSHYKGKKQFGARFQVTGFYQQSENRHALGKYFGFLDTNSLSPNFGMVEDFIGVDAVNEADPLFPADVIHDAARGTFNVNRTQPTNDFTDPIANPLSDELQFRPRREVGGAEFLYYQNLDAWTKGLYFKVSTPLVHVRNNLGVRDLGPNHTQKTDATATTGVPVYNVTDSQTVTFLQYLQGNVVQVDDPNQQAALTSLKFPTGSLSETGLADVKFMLGYDILHKECYHLGLNFLAVAPTDEAPEGTYLWETVVGNGGHWAIGATLDGHYDWKISSDFFISLHLAIEYQWVFEKAERRTLGFNNRAGNFVPFGWYTLGGQKGSNILFPLANVLTRKVEVEPGSKVDSILAVNFGCCNWMFDLGYNLFYKDEEGIELKEAWPNDTFAVANFAYSTGPGQTQPLFDPTNTVGGHTADAHNTGSPTAIESTDLVLETASSPSQVTHKVFGGAGYIFNQWSTPLLIGVGGSYEIPDESRVALEQWSVWLRLGIAV